MGGAVQRNQLSCLSRDCNHVSRVGRIDEESVLALPYSEVGGFVDLIGKQLKLLVRNLDQHIAPVVLMGQSPHRRPQDKLLAAGRTGQKTTSAKRLRQAEGAA